MKTNMKYLSLVLLAATACGDNKLAPDARVRPDTGSGGSDSFPAAPTLGTQIDRVGRPAINTLLNHGFDPTADAGSAKEKYNADTGSGSGWVATWRGELAKNAAIIDALDTGMCGNGTCETGEIGVGGTGGITCQADCGSGVTIGSGAACGNTVLYNVGVPNPNPGNPLPPNPGSYVALGSLLAQDEIFLNTSKGACQLYLAVEYYVATNAADMETTCGGRKLDYDVVDFSLSMLAAGVGGFDIAAGFLPKIGDGVAKHTDYLADFPFLGNPH
jgi:hypothetical protein